MGELKGLFQEQVFDPAIEQRTIRIAASGTQTILLTPMIMARLSRNAPGVDLRMEPSAKCAATDERQMDGKHGVLGQLSMMETHMVDHLEVIRAQKAALEPLFNGLSDDQKKAANETLTYVMKVGMSMGGGGMSEMGGMDHGGGKDGKDGIQHGGGMGSMGGMQH